MQISQENLEQYYLKIIDKLNNKVELFEKISKKYSLIRLTIFLVAIFLFIIFYLNDYETTSFYVAGGLGIIFSILVYYHNKVEKSIRRFKIYTEIKKENLARLNLDWSNIPYNESLLGISPSPIEQDLNVVEKKGLLHLISTGISFESIIFLRNWLDVSELRKEQIINRQKIIAELKNLTRFRDKLLLVSRLSLSKEKLKVEITEWLKNAVDKKGIKQFTVLLTILSTANLILLVGYFIGFLDSYYYQLLIIYLFTYFWGYRYVKDIKSISDNLFEEIRKYSSIFNFIEKYNYGNSDLLKGLLKQFLHKHTLPSRVLNSVNFTIEVLNLRTNPFIWFAIMCILPIDYLLALKVEKFRKTIKSDFPLWLKTFNQLEAYSSLATFAYLNPEYSFAKFDNNNLIVSEKLGHPLIKYEKRITNDFSINDRNRTNIITGSNMSGKSTFLRTIGINTLLGYAGSVVCAKTFIISEYDLYTCIKVSDSVIDGISYFYAEVKRLKNIIDEIKKKDGSSLVLIDEIYKGTNNVERFVGSKAFIKYLSEQRIFSIISTHDLEMVNVENELKAVNNYHFKEIIDGNKMTFDYKLMEGPCPTTNALKIMEIEGLPT